MSYSHKDITNRDTYDRIAKIYADKHFDVSALQDKLDEFITLLPQQANILDLGCGPGNCSNYFAQQGLLVTGIDFSEKMIAIAKELVGDIEFINANILEYPFEEDEYDGIWASGILLHFTTDELQSLLQRINKALRTEGIFFASFMEGEGERRFERVDRGVEDVRYFYDRRHEEAITLLEEAGFELIKSKRDESGPVTFMSYYLRKK